MAEVPLHTVSFQAAHTNSAPPPIPYHIYQALRGDVGTTQLPSGLSAISRFLAQIIAALNFAGIWWIFWHFLKTPIVGAILATFVAAISLSLAGLFHGIPYLEHRRSAWTEANWRILRLCFVISLAASSTISYLFISYPQTINLKSTNYTRSRPIGTIRAELANAHNICQMTGDPYHCAWRPRLSFELAEAKRELELASTQSAKISEQQTTEESEEDALKRWATYAAVVLVLCAVHAIATYGTPFSSETGSAIWREPHSGYQKADSSPKTWSNQSEDTNTAKTFREWLQYCVKTVSDAEPSIKTQEAHTKYSKFCESNGRKPLDLASFLEKLKLDTGKEPMGDKIYGMSVSEGIV